ncbi:serine hydrolase domain-containing protein [Stutzerimonas tarimensis]|uniref:Serine hydrolase domain-containing protein n=1 Tax=Stutzerimonas tarimensis TaxID=1507735 RepID=A0ABV7T9T2_9GAMM
MQVQGYFDLRFESVRDTFASLFEGNRQRGAALCVQVGGETVLDLWAGTVDAANEAVWHSDTLVNLFSCSKTLAATSVLQLVAEGRLALDAPLAGYWPAFGRNGKEAITLRQVLCHRAGLPALREPLPAQALYDWQRMTCAVAEERPWWTPGDGQGYAPMTFGWILGELLRLVDGRAPGEAIIARVARPLGFDLHLGLGDEAMARTAYLGRVRNDFGDEGAQRLMKAVAADPASLVGRAFGNPPGFLNSGNKPEWQRSVLPAANLHGNARSLAGFYAALLDGRLLAPELLAEMTREHSLGEDLTLLARTRYGLGCWLDQPGQPGATFGMGPASFGHPGAGGCLGFADPERQVAFGFVTNTLGPYVMMDPRAQALAQAVGDCLS